MGAPADAGRAAGLRPQAPAASSQSSIPSAVSLHLGDCLQVMPSLGPVDAIICDLPYETTRCRWDSQIPLEPLWAEYRRLCSGPILLFAQTPFDKVLGASNLRDLRYEWIWEKTHATGHLNAKRAPLKAHENILVFYRKQPTYNPQKTTGHTRKTAVKRGDRTDVYGVQTIGALSYDSTERYPRSVQVFPSDKQREALHSTQKPLALCEYLIRTYTNPGDVVLDNCMGSGTTGVAAVRTGRRFIGIEKDPAIFQVARQRIAQAMSASGQDPQGLEAKPASAVRQDAPDPSSPFTPSTEDNNTAPAAVDARASTGEA